MQQANAILHGKKKVPQSFGDLPSDGNTELKQRAQAFQQSRDEVGSWRRGRGVFDRAIISGETVFCQNFHSPESISTQLLCNLISCVSSQGNSV